MSLEVIPFDKELIKSFVYNGVEKEISGEEILPILNFYNRLGPVYMGLIDGKIIGVGGFTPLWDHAGSFFLFLNREAQNYKKSIFKALLKYINELTLKYKIKTLMVECLDNVEAKTLIEHLGFKRDRTIFMARYIKPGE